MADYSGTQGADGWEPASSQADASSGGKGLLGTAVNLLGALASVALIGGIGYWGYKLVMRDVSGVPVVRAAQSAMREQPAEPGGSAAAHQGLAVNAVAAEGAAEATAEQLVLAPSPVDLAEEDAPMPALLRQDQSAGTNAEPETMPEASDATVQSALQAGAVDALLKDLLGEGPTPQAAAEPTGLSGPGVAHSPRPRIRPDQVAVVTLASVTSTEPQLDVDPASLPAGTKLAQLGAFESAEIARAEWDRLGAEFGDYLEGKRRVIQKASSGGREFYRLRAMGFDDLSAARRFCAAFAAKNADCIPVVVR